MFGALEFYDIEDVFVCKQSLLTRNITLESLCIDVTVLDADDWRLSLHQHTHILSF